MRKLLQRIGAVSGAAFLMATSAIGPGFINNTSLFTRDLGASFGFIILAALLLDIVVQLCVWLTIGLKGRYAQQIAQEMLPGSGHALSLLIALGGLVFNIGNMAGCVLGLQILFDLPVPVALLVSMAVALPVLLVRRTGRALDLFGFFLGLVMITLMLAILTRLDVPVGQALVGTFRPERIDLPILLTIIGGTVGGYISFAGAHHLVDAGVTDAGSIRRGAVRGIVITSLMRYLLFLAALSAVAAGAELSADNPAASVFAAGAGAWGEKVFGVVLWSAAITSVVGSSYTSFSFVKTLHPALPERRREFLTLVITASALFLWVAGKPAQLLVFAGAFNGVILPFALLVVLGVIFRHRHLPEWRFAWWVSLPGWIVAAGLLYMSYTVLRGVFG
jgi:Mn2+/Fe2+ NRAMP family transporter